MFVVTLIDDTAEELDNLKSGLRRATTASLTFAVRHEARPVAASFPLEAVHAIVFTPRSLARTTAADVEVVQSATKPGTCRVYLLVPDDEPVPASVSPLDDFIQRTRATGLAALAAQIIAFFHEADDLNRRNARFARRDEAFLRAYNFLKVLWPISYVFAALHFLNALAVLAGGGPWPSALASRYVNPVANFFGALFIAHCVYVIVRNALFAGRIAKQSMLEFAPPAAALGLAASVTAYSIVALNDSAWYVLACFVFAVCTYLTYLHARRIRVECTSLSEIHAAMKETRRRKELLDTVGRHPLPSAAFPLLPFRSRSLFISYMHGSAWSSRTADLIHHSTARSGWNVWMDQSSIPSGTLWRQYLLRALSECGFFIAVLDDEAAITDWVLAESIYAAMLRKSIGKPHILLVVRNSEGLSRLQNGPFGMIYMDVFQLPPALCHGAGILAGDGDELTESVIARALDEIRPMCLLP